MILKSCIIFIVVK